MTITTPALIDIHCHLRDPGQTHKESIETGCAAARNGGFGIVCSMPNTTPVTDTPELVRYQIQKCASLNVRVIPIGAITKNSAGKELTDFKALRRAGACAVSDDGLPLTDDNLMKQALVEAAKHNLTVVSHCEPETELADRHIYLARQTGYPVHIAHVSLSNTVDLIRRAKAQGVRVTAETCPHYLTPLASGKMNPPLASNADITAVIEGLLDDTIDCIATDHAPHTAEEKASANPPNGVIGLETAFGVTLTALYHTKLMSIERVLTKMRERPAEIMKTPYPIGLIEIDTDREWTVGEEAFASKSSNTAFGGVTLRGKARFVQ